jgi:DNA processing protein
MTPPPFNWSLTRKLQYNEVVKNQIGHNSSCYTFRMTSRAIRALLPDEFPPLLAEIPEPPEHLWLEGALPHPELKLLAVVGSRQYTDYGKQVVEHLIGGLAGYPVGIVSGLALGIDSLAHEAALRHGLYTVAVPGSGLDHAVLYPASHKRLASCIVKAHGGLLSEFPPTMRAAKWTFTQRNRIMAGMSHATILIEAAEKSGTLITARMAVDYNRELLVVPGNIFARTAYGVHQFLKLGATPVTTANDILTALGIETRTHANTPPHPTLTITHAKIITLLHEPQSRDTLIRALDLPIAEASVILMEMEIMGLIVPDGNNFRAGI